MSRTQWTVKGIPEFYPCHHCNKGKSETRYFPKEHLRVYQGKTICRACWFLLGSGVGSGYSWKSLPHFLPEVDQKIGSLEAQVSDLTSKWEASLAREEALASELSTVSRVLTAYKGMAEQVCNLCSFFRAPSSAPCDSCKLYSFLHQKESYLEESHIPRTASELKDYCVAFFRWWWNRSGTNTEGGYDEWRKSQLKKAAEVENEIP